ncbi:MAG: TonB-dependent receptor [Proteobacteria bacterium]|nr:TonB-dependent receptor [Pseudomonadota bacterium]
MPYDTIREEDVAPTSAVQLLPAHTPSDPAGLRDARSGVSGRALAYSKLLWGALLLVLLAATRSATAQAQDEGGGDEQGTDEQGTDEQGTDEQGTTKSDRPKNVEQIRITGIRSSIQRAQDTKREADSVVDAISAIGLGRFADTSLADAFQRIPGVQIQRNDGAQEGDRASVRGLGPAYVKTTINGRTPLSSGTEALTNLRVFNLDVIPTSIISGTTVKKTTTASDVESGLAGLVEIQTRKPLFDANYRTYDNFFGSVTTQADRGSIGRRIGPRVSGIVGGRNDDHTFGAYLMGLAGKSYPGRNQLFPGIRKYNIQMDTNGDGIRDQVIPDVFVINDIDFEPIREARGRSSLAGAVQWRPLGNLEISAEGVFTYYNNVSFRNRIAPVYGDAIQNTVFTPDQLVIDHTNTLQSVAPGVLEVNCFNDRELDPVTLQPVIKAGPACRQGVPVRFIPFYFSNKTKTTVTGINFDYKPTETFRAKLDVSYNRVDYFQDLDLPIMMQTIDASQVSFNTDNGLFSSDLGQFPLNGFDLPRGQALIRDVFMDGQELGFRLDFENALDYGVLDSIEYGARVTRADVDSTRTNILDATQDRVTMEYRYSQTDINARALQAIAQDRTSDYNFFPGKGVLANEFPIGSRDQLYAAIPELGHQQDLGVDPASSFAYVEDVAALYAESNLRGELLDRDFGGNIGVRLVGVRVAGEGFAVQEDGSRSPMFASNTYWRPWPSANVSLDLQEDLVLRLAAGRVLSRPNPSDLAPRQGAIRPNSVGDPWIGKIGNPELKPTTSWNFDATLEYYTPNDGSVILSGFYKEVTDFVYVQTTVGSLPGYPTAGSNMFIFTPQNISDGRVFGFELGFNQPFTFLTAPWDGFGLQGNYTFVRSKFDNAEVDDGGYGFPGASRNNINAIGYYEKGPIAVRVAYVYRDDFFRNLAGQGAQQENAQPVWTQGNQRFNINATFHITDNYSVFADVNNIFAEGRRDFYYQRETFNGAFEREATLTLGVTGAY